MFKAFKQGVYGFLFRAFVLVVLMSFTLVGVMPPQQAFALGVDLPRPGTMIKMTSQFMPALVKGIKVDPQNPLLFEFLIEPGQVPLNAQQKKDEYRKLIKYFLASLTTPEKDMWVNLSPYENNRIISRNFGTTEMGRDMLAQDYILKQLAASLVYPEDELGKKFWSKVYERVRLQTGAAEVPVSTFNKVWILPASATVFEKGNVAMVTESRLRVMMEEDYNALRKNDQKSDSSKAASSAHNKHSLASQTVREIVIPAIEQEINEGANFAQLRQMYNAMVLASWFKQRLKMHLLSRVYVNKDKAQGVDLKNPQENEEIYQQYIKAYKKGVYNYIKEEEDPLSGQIIPRKYFSGGFDSSRLAMAIDGQGVLKTTSDPAMATAAASAALDRAMVSLEPGQVEDARAEVSEVSDTGDISVGGFAEAIEEELNRINREEGVSIEMITRALGDAQTRSVIFEETVLRLKEQNDLSDEAASQTALRVINKMQEIVDIVGILRQEFEANVSQEQFLRDMYEIAVKVAIGQQIEDFEPDVKPLPTAQVEAILNVIQRVREAYTAGEITDAYRQAEAELAAIKERVQEQEALRETQNVPEADISFRQDKAERLLLTLGQEVLKFQSQQNELRAKAELLVEQYGRLADLDIDQQATNKLKLDQEANALRAAFALNKGAYQKALSRRMAVLRIKGSQILPAVEERLFSDYMSTSSTIDSGSLRQQKLEAYLSFLKEVKPSFLKDLQETEKALGRSFDLPTYEDQLRIAETRAQERLGVLQDAYQQEQRAKEAAAQLIARIRQAPLALPAPGESQALQAQEERRLAQELKEANQRRDEARVKELFNALQTLKRQRQQEDRMARASQAARQAPKRQTPLLALPAPGESQAPKVSKVLSKKEQAVEEAREVLRIAQVREKELFVILHRAQDAERKPLPGQDVKVLEEATDYAISQYNQAQIDARNAQLRLDEAIKLKDIDEDKLLSSLQEQALELDRQAEEAFNIFRQELTQRGKRDLEMNILDLEARVADLRHELTLKDIVSRQEKDPRKQLLLRNEFVGYRQYVEDAERMFNSVIVLADRLAQARETFDEAREKEEDKGYVDELQRIFQATERQTLIEVEMALANIRFAGEEAQTQEQKEEEKPELEPIDDEAARNIFSLFGFAGEAQLSIAAEEESALAQIGIEPAQQVRTPVLSSPFAGKTNTRQIRSEIDRLSNQATTPELKERLKELLGQTIAYAESRQMKELASFARTKLTRMSGDLSGEQPRMTTPLTESDSEPSLETSPAPQTGLIVPLTAPETAPQKDAEPASGIKRSSLSALTSFFLRAAVFLAVLTPSSQLTDTTKNELPSAAIKPLAQTKPRVFAPVFKAPLIKPQELKLPALPPVPLLQELQVMRDPKILLPEEFKLPSVPATPQVVQRPALSFKLNSAKAGAYNGTLQPVTINGKRLFLTGASFYWPSEGRSSREHQGVKLTPGISAANLDLPLGTVLDVYDPIKGGFLYRVVVADRGPFGVEKQEIEVKGKDGKSVLRTVTVPARDKQGKLVRHSKRGIDIQVSTSDDASKKGEIPVLLDIVWAPQAYKKVVKEKLPTQIIDERGVLKAPFSGRVLDIRGGIVLLEDSSKRLLSVSGLAESYVVIGQKLTKDMPIGKGTVRTEASLLVNGAIRPVAEILSPVGGELVYEKVEDIVIRAAREVVKKIGPEGDYIDKDKPGIMTTKVSQDRLNALISDPSFPSGEKSVLAMRLKEFAGGKASFTEQEISDMQAMVDAWHRDFPENNKPQASAELADGQEPVLPLRPGVPSSDDLLLLPAVGAIPNTLVADKKEDKKNEIASPVQEGQKVTDIRSKIYTIKKGSILADRVYAPLDQVVVTSSFGVNRAGLEAKKATHPGTDLKAAIGTPVYSMFDGKVIMSAAEDDTGGYGNMVAVLSQEKDGRFIIHMYAHLNSKPTLKKGDFIKGGASIGKSGDTGKITGPHLHLEFRNLDPRVAVNVLEGRQDFNLGMGRHYAGNLLNPQDYLAQLDAVRAGEFAELKLKGDDAMTTDPYGGIDFDAKYLDLNMKGEAIELSIPEGFQWLINTPIRGFTPQILDIRSGLGFQLSFFKGLLDEGQERTAKANAQGRMSLAAANHKFTMMCALARA